MRRIAIIALTMMIPFALKGQELSDSLSATYVLPEGRVMEIVRNAARDFRRRHAADLVCLARYERVVKSREHYCQLLLSEGIFGSFGFSHKDVAAPFEDQAMGRFRALNTYVSLFRMPGTNDYARMLGLTNPNVDGLDRFYVNYNQEPITSPVSGMRAMEIYGPLNPGKLKYYSFRLENYSPGREIYTVHFTSKEGAFPRRIRLLGEGQLFISRKNGILGFKLLDAEDRFSHFIRVKVESRLPSVTSYTMEVRYRVADGQIVPDHLVQETHWVKPHNENRKLYYYAEINPCKNPFDKGVVSCKRVTFYNPVSLKDVDNEMLSLLRRALAPNNNGWFPCLGDIDPAYPSPDIDKVAHAAKIRSDLQAIGIGLEEQSSMQKEIYEDYIRRINAGSGQADLRYEREMTAAMRQVYDILYRSGLEK